MALRPIDEIAVILDSFQCTLHSTVSVVRQNTDVVRVNRFRLYLLTAVVPIRTISCKLGLERQDIDTTGQNMVVCQRIWGHDTKGWISAGIATDRESGLIVE